ncbi:hypothetical protein B0H17DRAFT_962341, partial [Mycena rosella]
MKPQAGHNNIGYRHVDTITVHNHPSYVPRNQVRTTANAQWVLTDLVNMATFLEPHVSGDGNKYKAPVIKGLTDYLNDRIVAGGLKRLMASNKNWQMCVIRYSICVNYLKTRSGGNWDDDFGANVITQTEAELWDALVLSRPECTPFRNQGWPPYSFFERLDPAKPKG